MCSAFNEGQCRFLPNCHYKHECSYCTGSDPAISCFSKASTTTVHPQPHDTTSNNQDTNEALKNVTLALQLIKHQDGSFFHDGFKEGFLVSAFMGKGCSSMKHLHSVHIHPDIVTEKIKKEPKDVRIAGPFSSPPFPNVRLSPLRLVPKKELCSFHLIHYLPYLTSNFLNHLPPAHHQMMEEWCPLSFREDVI